MRRRRFLRESARGVIGVSGVLLGCSRAEAPLPTELETWRDVTDDLAQRIPHLLKEHAVPGLGIALIRDAQIVWERGFGLADAEAGTPVDVPTIFEAASMSKPVFAYAVMQLVDRGIIDLDTPLQAYLNERPVADTRWDRVTPRYILSHRSGLPNWRTPDTPLAIAFEPGERWQYSGEGYYYLQSVVTRLTGRVDPTSCGRFEMDVQVCATDIGEFMQANVLRPFGMTSSLYDSTDARVARLARGHDEKGLARPRPQPNPAAAARYASAGGLSSTPSDYARFLIEVIAPKPVDRFRISTTTRDEMIRPVVSAPGVAPAGSSWALGWQAFEIDGSPIIAHGGNQPGFNAYAAASVRHRSGYVMMTNGDSGYAVLSQLANGDAIGRVLRGWPA